MGCMANKRKDVEHGSTNRYIDREGAGRYAQKMSFAPDDSVINQTDRYRLPEERHLKLIVAMIVTEDLVMEAWMLNGNMRWHKRLMGFSPWAQVACLAREDTI